VDDRGSYLYQQRANAMKRFVLFLSLIVFVAQAQPQDFRNGDNQAQEGSSLDLNIGNFEVNDAVMRDGVSELSLKNIEHLHLGFEEIIRQRIQDDARSQGVHFSIHLTNRTVRQIIDALCEADEHYTWSQDGNSINIYPRATIKDVSYLLNLQVQRIVVSDIPDPNEGLTPLSKLFPAQQIGYFGSGLGDNKYEKPWSAVFEEVSVRRFINRIAEHMGPQTSWVWEGGAAREDVYIPKGGLQHAETPQITG